MRATAEMTAADALAGIVVDFWAPIGPGANLLRATDGRCYIHEYDRWLADPVVREVAARTVYFPLLQDYPDPYTQRNDWPTEASGEIEA